MDRAEFRQWAMIYAMQGLLASSSIVSRDYMALAVASAQIADCMVEANTIDEVPQ
jgi:hypothetical protein